MRSRKWSLRKIILVGIMTLVVILTAAFAWNEYMLHQAQLAFIQLLETEQGNYNEDRVVLSATTQAEAQRMTDEFGGRLRITDDGRFAVINLPDGTTLTDIAKEKSYRKYHDRILLDYNNFRTAEEIIENAEVRASYQVNDAMYPQQTYLDYLNIGDTWNLSRGKTKDDEKITVAIIDSGIDTDHPEFIDAEGNSIISPQSYDATNDRVTDQYGISVIEDENGHGTAVAGVIAAQMNDVGITGIAPDVELLVIKCEVDETGEFKSSADIVFAIYYAIEMDADVINMSLGGDDSKDMASALQLAVDSDIICVAAAGNDGNDFPHYPAVYDTVIGVGALADDSWEIASYSNYGVNSDIMAPGTALTTNMGGEYTYQEGTSIAAPMVSASVALYLSQNEYATYDTVKAELEAAGRDLGDLGEDETYGFGALDLNAFVCEEKGIITYDYCTEEFKDTTQIFVRQHTIQTVPEPERENVVFDDWYYDKAYTRVFDYDAWYSTEFVEDITLYAKWVNEDDEGASVYNYRTLGDGTIEIVSYKGKRRYLTIPNEIDGKIVSSIGSNAFSGNTRLREVIFPEGLVYIKANAFKGVTKMRDITFTGTQLQEIQASAFWGCSSLKALDLPDSVRILGKNVFANCTAMTAVDISADSQLERIDDAAFSNTKITSFYLPANVGADGFNGSVLAGCSGMRSISVHGENTGFYVSNKTLYDAAGTKIVYYPAALTGSYAVADDVVTIGKYAFAGSCISAVDLNRVMTIEANAFKSTRNLSAVFLPDSVTSLGGSAFELSSITQVRISENLTAIAERAFSDTKLTSVYIPAKVQTIDSLAFSCCARLKKLSFAEDAGLTVIGEGAFDSCGLLGSFTLPDSLQTIASNAFYKCASITELTIPVNVSKIGKEAFRYCTRLQNITFADGCVLTTVPESCFANCTMLQTVRFSDAINTLGRSAFSNDYLLRELDFNETSALSTIRDQCFYSCSMLQTMQLPGRVSTIGEFAYTFSGLTQVDISAGITSIGNAAFGGCYSLSQINVDENNPSYATVDNVLFNKDITTVYCVPSTRTGTYTLPDTVAVTAPYSFYYDTLLSGVVLPEGLADIQQNSFYNCSSLAGVEIPANVTNIGREAFYDCYLLKDVSFSSGSKLQRLGIYTFVNCGMTDITIPASVEEIAQYVFYNCRNLKEITFEANSALTYVAAYLFRGTKVETVVFEEGSALTSLQAHSFDGAYYLKHVDFGDAAITNVDNYAFYNCSALEDILIPDSVTYIGRYAFYNCAKLDRMALPAGMDYIGESAFSGTNNMKVYFAGAELPANVQFGWDNGISGYFLDAVDYIITDEWEYAVSASGTISLADYKGDAAELTIDTVDGYTVAKIGARCFAGNDTLTSISLSDHITEIGNYAFYDCNSLNSVTIPTAVTRIGRYAFAGSSAVISFADNSELKVIDDYAFAENGTTEMDIPDSVTEIGEGAFLNSELSVLTISDSSCLESIGSEAFVGSSIASVNLPETLSHVGEGAFKNVATLTDVTIVDGDTALKLSNSAFEGSGISEITIPARVYYIGEYTFSGCPNLQNIHVDSTNGSYTELDGVLCDIYGTTLIQYPSGRSGAYEVPQQITVLAYASFKNAKFLTEVSFSEGSAVKTIGWQTFSGCESLAKITVPDSVVSFDFYAFENCTSLTDVILTDNSQLSGVYKGAFYGCSALTNLTLPDTVTEIGDYAFYNCESLTAVPLSASAPVKGIYDYAFYGCSGITEVPAFSQLVEIGAYAFAYTGVETFTVGAALKEIAPSAFVGCEAFTAISCDEANTEYTAIDGGLYEKGADSADDYDALVIWPYGKKWILGEGKTELTSADTQICKMLPHIQYEIADTVTSIGPAAFYRCSSLMSITIPESVTSIGSAAFKYCSSLTSITIPDSVTNIGIYAFYGCSSLKTAGPIGGGYNCEFGWTERIPSEAFEYCSSLTSITIPEGVTTIGSSAFFGCRGLTSITIPESVTNIGAYAFYGCSGLKTAGPIGGGYNCEFGWTEIIPLNAFSTFSSLTSITIPDSVTSIGSYAFRGCSSLTGIWVSDSHEYYCSDDCGVLYNKSMTSLICAPGALEGEYTIPEGVTSIGDYAFYGCSSLTSITIPEGVTSIGRDAFMNCSSLTSITIPESVTSIDWHIFEGCSGLKTAGPIGGGYDYEFGWTESIPEYAFYRCSSLTSITIPDSVTSIGRYVFYGCSSLTSITIPDSVISIGGFAFYGCSSLTSITIPESVTGIGSKAFYGCSSLTSITIPESVTSIGSDAFLGCGGLKTAGPIGGGYDCEFGWTESIPSDAFSGCSSLTSITIPDSVTSIGYKAFYGCSSLTSIKFLGDAPPIGIDAFYGVTATAYYSCYNDTWTTDVMRNYGGTLTWVSYDPCEDDHTTDKAVVENEVAATCTQDGSYDYVVYCRYCRLELSRQTVAVIAKGHSYEAVVTAPSCTKGGYTTYICYECGDMYVSDHVDELGHSVVIDEAVEPSCCIGLTEGSHCSVCRTIFVSQEVIPAISDHSITDGKCVTCGLKPVAYGTCGDNASWMLSTDGVLYIYGSGGMARYSSGSAPWYSYRTNIKRINLGNIITNVGSYAFYNCTSLASITIPEGVSSVGDSAFHGCSSLTSITIPDSVTSIGGYAFSGCSSLTSITIPESVTSIGNSAFKGCSGLKTAGPIGGGYDYEFGWTDSIPSYAFYGCSGLTSITIPESVTSIGDSAFEDCSSLTSITIPDSVTSIGDSAFEDCSSLTSITIPDSVTSVGDSAFRGCSSLTSITIPEGVTSISQYAFKDCSSLTSVTIPDSVNSIGSGVFSGCSSLTSITIPDSVTSIGSYAFRECSSLKTAGPIGGGYDYEFGWKKSIPAYAFSGCSSLTSITIPESVTSIGDSAFSGCSSLTSITIPDGATSIGNYAFHGCSSLTSITIPESVTSIGSHAFNGCSSLTSVTIPDSVTSIGNSAFRECSSLTSITFPGDAPTIGSNAFYGVTATVYYSCYSDTWIIDVMQNYGGTLTWVSFDPCPNGHTEVIDIAVEPSCVDGLTEGSHCSVCGTILVVQKVIPAILEHSITDGKCVTCGLKPIVYGTCGTNANWLLSADGVLYIYGSGEMARYTGYSSERAPWYSFQKEINRISLGNRITNIGSYAFSGCTSLASITIPDSVTSIGDLAFYGCSSLTSITIPESVTSIGQRAFEDCSSLTSITIPESVTSIGNGAFKGCRYLTSITIPDSVTSIGNSAFSGCSSLTNITIPESVTGIGYYAFENCSSLASIIFHGDAPIIKSEAFSGVTAIAYYSCYNGTWTADVMQNYGGTLTWVSYDPCEDGHTADEAVVENEVAATCTQDGSYDSVTYCTVCKAELIRQTVTITAKGHSHESVVTAPTCTEQGYTTHTCANCGDSYVDTYVDALGHDMDEWTTVTEATCTEDGSERRNCSRCDHYETRTIKATGHSFGTWFVNRAATCTEAGENRRNCSACSHYETEVIPATGHSHESVVTAPTCTEQGYTTHTCSNCGDSYVDTYVDALGHDMGEWTTVTEASCTEDGSERRDCSRCDHYETRSIEATGHSFGAWFVNRSATCTEDGENRRNCSNCSHYETEVIPAIGHSYEPIVTVPTCVEQGYSTHTCTNCGDSYTDAYVDALGHDMGEWTTVTEATCTESGAEHQDCSRCDHFETRIIEATGHSFGTWFVNRAATCTEDGENRRNCNNCSHYETKAIPTIGHDYESLVTAPTCVEQGYTTHTCTVCGESYMDSYVDALGHDMGEWTTITEAACTEDGSERRDCSRCDHYETRTIEAAGHVYESVVTVPTCVEKGYTTHTCTKCGDSYVDTYVDALGHDMGEWTTVTEATCTEDGENRRICGNCGHYETEVIPATGHSYEHVVTTPICTEQGYTTHTCTVCGDSYVDTYVDALGHDMGEWTTVAEANCTEDGQELRECTRCDRYETRIIEAFGHSYESIVTAPTCTEQGYTQYICSVCGDSFISDYMAPTGHKYDEVVTDPTCTEQGYTTYTCHCGDWYVSDYTDPLGHDMGAWESSNDATCTEDGQELRECSRCDYSEVRAVEALGHEWDEGVVTIEPTEETEGEITYTCERCSETRTEILPELEHEHRYDAVVTAPTCTDQGYTTYTCRCGDSYVDSYVDALGHDMGEWETVTEATCTVDGLEQRDCSHCDYHETQVIGAIGHDYESVVTEPTCIAQGFTTHTCTNCDDSYVDTYVDALSHSFTEYVSDDNATCTQDGTKTSVCDRCDAIDTVIDEGSAHGHDFTEWTVVQKPTETVEGLESRYCLNCGVEETRAIACLVNPFGDVPSGSFYYEPVMWAVENGITNGTSATTFGPNDQCMRAHVVTFLWRAMGCPEPTETDNPFVDVKSTDFYYKPVLWALENGITSGMDATHFGPTSYCNRAQVVTFLYRTMGSPELESAENPFTDVAKGSFYEKPVLWAVENGITNGLSATSFGPNSICNRAQIVTFLYRAFVD